MKAVKVHIPETQGCSSIQLTLTNPGKDFLFFFLLIFKLQETVHLKKGKVCFNRHTDVVEFSSFLKSFHVPRA